VTEAQLPLAQLARIGPYFALHDGSDAGFEPVASLIADTAQAAARLGERIDDVAARLGTVQRWIGASIRFQGWAARLTSIYAGSAVLAGPQPAELRRCGRWRDTPDGLRYARTTCCGFIQLAGGRRCGDCPLSWRRAPASPPRPASAAREPEADAGDR
jgi:hypothetical protein